VPVSGAQLKARVTDGTYAPGQFSLILAAFFSTFLLSWPIVFSLDLWVFKDRGSLLNLDYLLEKHLQLGVDTFYSYGLLPVLIQHLLFAAFGRGYWPLIACTIATLILTAGFWALLLRHFPKQLIWLISVIAMSPTLFQVNPNLPYSLVQVSMLFALLFVLEGRLDIALAVSVVGCLSVPSLPLVLTALLLLLILIDWRINSDRSAAYLIRQIAPGACAYVLLALILCLIFGYRSVVATALPVFGIKFYRTVHYTFFGSEMGFLNAERHGLKYYIEYFTATPLGWLIASILVLFVLGAQAIGAMIRDRAAEPSKAFVGLCAIIEGILVFFAYGPQGQHTLYDPILVAGMLVGISRLSPGRWRKVLLVTFVALGVLSQSALVRRTWLDWKETRPSLQSANLYAEPAWTEEWSKILEISKTKKVLLLSYGTGVHHYFPTIQTADVWFLRTGQLFPADKRRLLAKIQDADVIVEDLSGPTSAIDADEDIQSRLSSMCLTDVTLNFQIWWRHPWDSEQMVCMPNARRKQLTGSVFLYQRGSRQIRRVRQNFQSRRTTGNE
jgi:hypothetical protein